MRMRQGFAKLHGKIIPYKTKKHDFGKVYCCKNVRKCRRFTILERDIVKLDDGTKLCQECASKLTNQV